jgi:hypothetical protein
MILGVSSTEMGSRTRTSFFSEFSDAVSSGNQRQYRIFESKLMRWLRISFL